MELIEEEQFGTQVKEKYIRTELGLIPKDWKIIVIGDYAKKVGSGKTPKGGEKVYQKAGRAFIRSQNVGWGHLKLNDLVYISEEIHSTFLGSEIQLNDVLLNITGASIGRSAIADQKIISGNVNQHVCIIRTFLTALHPQYLNYILLSKLGQSQIDSYQAGGNREGLNFSQIKSIKIPLPPTLAEQKAIAKALGDIDSLIIKLDKFIIKKKDIKLAAMQQLLKSPTEGGKRLAGFKGDWKAKKLGEVLKVRHGKSQHGIVDHNGKYPILATGGQIGRTNYFLYDKPSVLIGRKGTIDIPRYMESPFWTVDTLFYTEIFTTTYPKYVYYMFKLIDWYSYNEASGVPSLNASTIERIEKYFPPTLEEQKAIAAIVSDMDTEIESLEKKKLKYQVIKQGMMQDLLTGKTRLV
jgi:type I restriction enzyme S subunit